MAPSSILPFTLTASQALRTNARRPNQAVGDSANGVVTIQSGLLARTRCSLYPSITSFSGTILYFVPKSSVRCELLNLNAERA